MSMEPGAGDGRRRFHLRRRLGAGAFGEVYLADMISGGGFRRRVAIKLLHADVAKRAGAAKRMRDEARILGHLAHRHIVSVIDLIQLGDRWAVVMDYVPGADLEQVIAWCADHDEPFPPAAVLEIGAACATALDAAWSSDNGEGRPLHVVHRDIKPSNLRLTPDGDLKVLDFGVARVDMEHREASTREAGWIGTERYMAPERIMLDGDTPAGDVYALGASLIELLLGEPLGRTPVLPERHEAMVDTQLLRVEPMLAGSPAAAEVLAALRASVAADPEQRPDARALAITLDRLARQLGGETLRAFSARVVPPLIEPALTEPLDRVLTEGMAASPPPAPTRGTAAPTRGNAAPTSDLGLTTGGSLLDDADTRSSSASSAETPMPRARWLAGTAVIGLIAAIAATAGAIAVGTGVLLWNGLPADAPLAPIDAPAAVVQPAPVVTPAPVVAPDPAPPGAAEPAPTEPPAPRIATQPVEPAPAIAEVAPKATPAPVVIAADAPRISSAKVSFPDATSLTVTCGDVRRAGTSSVALRDAPAGTCTVDASWLGDAVSATFTLNAKAEIHCAMAGGKLVCAAP